MKYTNSSPHIEKKSEIYSKIIKKSINNLLDTTFILPGDDFSAQIVEVTEEFICRPDLLSKEVYGSEEYAFIICKLNGISNPLELNRGMLLAIPSPDSLDQFVVQVNNDYWKDYEILENKELTGNNDKFKNNKPVPKKSTDKNRRPNEALVTDKRFNIDKISKRIVY